LTFNHGVLGSSPSGLTTLQPRGKRNEMRNEKPAKAVAPSQFTDREQADYSDLRIASSPEIAAAAAKNIANKSASCAHASARHKCVRTADILSRLGWRVLVSGATTETCDRKDQATAI
jgi:hypothetical protein